MTPKITWIKRYSFTDEPDEMGRWKRHAQIDHPNLDKWSPLCIGEVSKFQARDKFTAHMFVPQRNGDAPCDTQWFERAEDAMEWVERNWEEFCGYFNP